MNSILKCESTKSTLQLHTLRVLICHLHFCYALNVVFASVCVVVSVDVACDVNVYRNYLLE